MIADEGVVILPQVLCLKGLPFHRGDTGIPGTFLGLEGSGRSPRPVLPVNPSGPCNSTTSCFQPGPGLLLESILMMENPDEANALLTGLRDKAGFCAIEIDLLLR